MTGIVGVYSDPGHVIAYYRGKKINEVRQPINVCLHAVPVGGELAPAPDEASEVHWVEPDDLDGLEIHPALRVRIMHGLSGGQPHVD